MNDFINTVGFKRLSESTIPDLTRKLDKVSKMDVDGLIKAINRMAQAQEEANRMAKREMRLQCTSVEQAEELESPKQETFKEKWDKILIDFPLSGEEVESFVLGLVNRIKKIEGLDIVFTDPDNENALRMFQNVAVRDSLISKRCDFCYKQDSLHVFDYQD